MLSCQCNRPAIDVALDLLDPRNRSQFLGIAEAFPTDTAGESEVETDTYFPLASLSGERACEFVWVFVNKSSGWPH
jgi:hypothetical protein